MLSFQEHSLGHVRNHIDGFYRRDSFAELQPGIPEACNVEAILSLLLDGADCGPAVIDVYEVMYKFW
jgi:hypothetical protein